MKIQLKLAVPLPLYKLTENIKVALDKDNNYIYVRSELSLSAGGLCAQCGEVKEQNIEVVIPTDEEDRFTVIHLVQFKLADYRGQKRDLSKEVFNEELKCLNEENPSFLEEHFILRECDPMIQNFEILHKTACLSYELIEPVKELKPILPEIEPAEVTDIPKTTSNPQSNPTWLNHKTAAVALVAFSTIGFFALKTISETMSSQDRLGKGL